MTEREQQVNDLHHRLVDVCMQYLASPDISYLDIIGTLETLKLSFFDATRFGIDHSKPSEEKQPHAD